MEKASGSETVDVAVVEWVYGYYRNSMPTSRSLCRKQWREQPNTIYLGLPQSAIIKQRSTREGCTVASGWLGLYQPWQPSSRPLTKSEYSAKRLHVTSLCAKHGGYQ